MPQHPLFVWCRPVGMTLLPVLPLMRAGYAALEPAYRGLKVNDWPPMEASYIRPPLVMVNTATPLL